MDTGRLSSDAALRLAQSFNTTATSDPTHVFIPLPVRSGLIVDIPPTRPSTDEHRPPPFSAVVSQRVNSTAPAVPQRCPISADTERPPVIPPRIQLPPELPPRPQPLLTSLATPPTLRGVPNDYVEDTSIPVGASSYPPTSSMPSTGLSTTFAGNGSYRTNSDKRLGISSPRLGQSAKVKSSSFSKTDFTCPADINGRLPRVRTDLISRGGADCGPVKRKDIVVDCSEVPSSAPAGLCHEPWLRQSEQVTSVARSPTSRRPAKHSSQRVLRVDCTREGSDNRCLADSQSLRVRQKAASVSPAVLRRATSGPSSATVDRCSPNAAVSPTDSAMLVLLPYKKSERGRLTRYGSQRSTANSVTAPAVVDSNSKKGSMSCAAGNKLDGIDSDGYPMKRPSIMCSDCGQCKCDSCVDPSRPLPFDSCCTTCIDYSSLMCVPRRIPCCSGSMEDGMEKEEGDDMCSCTSCRPRCVGRFTLLAALSLCLPCLCLYPLLRGARKGATVCYNGCRRKCRCSSTRSSSPSDTLAAPSKYKEAPL